MTERAHIHVLQKQQEGMDLNSSLGETGLRAYGGRIDQEFLRQLRGANGAKSYRQMRDNDAVVGAIMYAIESLIRQTEWRVEPAVEASVTTDGQPARVAQEAIDAAMFVEQCLADMDHTWDDLLTEILSMLTYGWAWFEEVYKIRGGMETDDVTRRSQYDDGKFGWRKIEIRSQTTLDRWQYNGETQELEGMWQERVTRPGHVFIPFEKSLLFRPSQHLNSPEGRSMLRNAFRSWYFKTRLEEIEAIGMERDLAGLPMMQVPFDLMNPNATAADKALRAEIEKLVYSIRRDEREGLVVPAETDAEGRPTGYKFELVNTGGRRSLDIGGAIVRYDQRIAMSVLAEFMLLGTDKVGSFALASSKTQLFGFALNCIMDSISTTFNRFGISRLMKLNGFSREVWPSLVHGEIPVSLEELGTFIKDTVGSGAIVPDAALERMLRMRARLPVDEEDEAGSEPGA